MNGKLAKAAGPLALAFVMVVGVLGSITPAQAQPPVAPTGVVAVSTAPDFYIPNYNAMGGTAASTYSWHVFPPSPNPLPNYPINPAVVFAGDKGVYQRTVRLAFGSMAATQVDFIYWIRDPDPTHATQPSSPPVCRTTNQGFDYAMDPCMPSAIRWNRELSYATRPGWTVEVDNTANSGLSTPPMRLLRFETDPANAVPITSAISGSSLWHSIDFVIAFEVQGSPNGAVDLTALRAAGGIPTVDQVQHEFHIQINALPPQTATPFETTCNANTSETDTSTPPIAQSAYTCVYTDPPFDGLSPQDFLADPRTGACSSTFGFPCNGSPGLVIRIDTEAPKIMPTDNGNMRLAAAAGGPRPCVCSFYSQDLDHNGHVDRFVVSFNEPVDPTTLAKEDFTIRAKGRDRGYTVTNAIFNDRGQCILGRTDLNPELWVNSATPPAVPLLVTAPGGTCQVIFTVLEMPFWDTGDTPQLSYNGDRLTDLAGNVMKKISGSALTAVDRASPVFTGAFAREGGHEIHLFFSENVVGSGGGWNANCQDDYTNPLPPSPCTSMCGSTPVEDTECAGEGMNYGQVTLQDLCYYDDGGIDPAQNVVGRKLAGSCQRMNTPWTGATSQCPTAGAWPQQAICRYFDRVAHTPALTADPVGTKGNGWKAMITTMPDPNNNNERFTFGEADVHPLYGDQIGVDTQPGSGAGVAQNTRRQRACNFAANFDVSPCDANIRDLWDNGMWYPTGAAVGAIDKPPAYMHIAPPLLVSAEADISHNLLTLTFNGPVRGPREPAGCDTTTASSKTGKVVYPCNIDIAATGGTGVGPRGILGPQIPSTTGSSTTSQAPYYLQPDTHKLLLQLDQPVRVVDVGLNPSRVKLYCWPNHTAATGGPAAAIMGASAVANDVYGFDYDPAHPTEERSYVPCDDPDMYYGPDQDADKNLDGPIIDEDADIVDRTPPRIIKAATSDANRDGYLDGMSLTFTEPIDDATFCGGDLALSAPTFCPDSLNGGMFSLSRWAAPCQMHKGLNKCAYERPEERIYALQHAQLGANPTERECAAEVPAADQGKYTLGFRWDTGLVSNDNFGTITLVKTTKSTDGTFVWRVENCQEYINGQPSGIRWPTNSLLHFTTNAQQLFQDLAGHPFHDNTDVVTATSQIANPNNLPQYCQFESKALEPGGNNKLAQHPDPPCDYLATTAWRDRWSQPLSKWPQTIRAVDGAPPVVWVAETFDTPRFDQNGVTDLKKEFNNLYGDGTIDGYRVTFSEPVSDGSFNKDDWKVEGYQAKLACPTGIFDTHNVTKAITAAPYETRPSIIPQFRIGNTFANDDQLIVLYTPDRIVVTPPSGNDYCRLAPDSGTTPELTYTKSNKSPHLSDLVGNQMLDFDEFDVQESDGAGPQITRIEGFPGGQELRVEFSEGVDDGQRNGLTRDDFHYFDKNLKGVAGFAGADPNHPESLETPVTHLPGDALAVVPLGGPMTSDDQAKDQIGARQCLIKEVAASVPAALRQCVPNYPRSLLVQNDTTVPAQILDLRVVTERTNANSVVLTWTAPGDDGTVGTVSSYTCYVSTDPITGDEVNDDGLDFKYDPDIGSLAGPGFAQSVQISGLDPETLYHFACEAFDNLGNPSLLSNAVSATTTRDITPPVGTIEISSGSHPTGVPKVERTANFTWTAVTDAESTVLYRYKLDANPEYIVLATDKSTTDEAITEIVPTDGDWYFHVAAFSAGGSTLTAHYGLTVGVAALDPQVIQDLNDKVNVTAVRQETDFDGRRVLLNNITWELPPFEEVKNLGTLEAIEVWREDDGVFTRLASPAPGCNTRTGTYNELKTGSCQDLYPGSTANSKYRVNMVFAGGQKQQDPVTGYTSLRDDTPSTIPPWLYIFAGIALALIIAGLVIFLVLRRRQRMAQTGTVAYSWESANPELLGIDESTGLPVHEVRCPSCNNPFQAVGALPLPVTCPTCGTTGQLD